MSKQKCCRTTWDWPNDVGRYPGGNSQHASCRAVYKIIVMQGGRYLFWTARCKDSQVCTLMFISMDLCGNFLSKARRVLMNPLGSNYLRVVWRIVLLELSMSVGLYNRHGGCRLYDIMLTYTSYVSRLLTYNVSRITPMADGP